MIAHEDIPHDKYSRTASNIRRGSITTPDAFIPWRGVKVSGIVLFLKLMTLGIFGHFEKGINYDLKLRT